MPARNVSVTLHRSSRGVSKPPSLYRRIIMFENGVKEERGG